MRQPIDSSDTNKETKRLIVSWRRAVPGFHVEILDPTERVRNILSGKTNNSNKLEKFFVENREAQDRPLHNALDPGFVAVIDKWAVVVPLPNFVSPLVLEQTKNLSADMPSFGPAGLMRYASDHEIGHVGEAAMGISWRDRALHTESYANYLSECRSDGYAAALAVARGGNPVSVAHEIKNFRANDLKNSQSLERATWPVLQACALVGTSEQSRNPVELMEKIDNLVIEYALDEKTYVSYQKMFNGQIEPTSLYNTHIKQVVDAAPIPVSLTGSEDKKWRNEYSRLNPKEADLVHRVPLALLIEQEMSEKTIDVNLLVKVAHRLASTDPDYRKLVPLLENWAQNDIKQPKKVLQFIQNNFKNPIDNWLQEAAREIMPLRELRKNQKVEILR